MAQQMEQQNSLMAQQLAKMAAQQEAADKSAAVVAVPVVSAVGNTTTRVAPTDREEVLKGQVGSECVMAFLLVIMGLARQQASLNSSIQYTQGSAGLARSH
jgi:hypothetical protein